MKEMKEKRKILYDTYTIISKLHLLGSNYLRKKTNLYLNSIFSTQKNLISEMYSKKKKKKNKIYEIHARYVRRF